MLYIPCQYGRLLPVLVTLASANSLRNLVRIMALRPPLNEYFYKTPIYLQPPLYKLGYIQ